MITRIFISSGSHNAVDAHTICGKQNNKASVSWKQKWSNGASVCYSTGPQAFESQWLGTFAINAVQPVVIHSKRFEAPPFDYLQMKYTNRLNKYSKRNAQCLQQQQKQQKKQINWMKLIMERTATKSKQANKHKWKWLNGMTLSENLHEMKIDFN